MSIKKSPRLIFAHSYRDVLPVLAGITHFCYLISMFYLFPHLPWWGNLVLGCIYAVSISWNINSVAHFFIHNAYFKSSFLNQFFSLMQSLTMAFSQTFYDNVHRRHHSGNSDLQDVNGDTVDWLSIYRYGKNGAPENVWAYSLKGFFRDEPGVIFNEIKRRNVRLAWFGVFEIFCVIVMVIIGFILNWKFMLFWIPFYYLGNCLSSLNGFYEHYLGNPNLPIAWGVSSYNWLYNITWFNNGYHAEHHYRPKYHWSKMRELKSQIADQQKVAGVRVIKWPHALGFLED